MSHIDAQEVARRMQIDFLEWPMLRVTLRQACRLWNAPHDVCEAALLTLVRAEFLFDRDGMFHRPVARGRHRGCRRDPRSAEPQCEPFGRDSDARLRRRQTPSRDEREDLASNATTPRSACERPHRAGHRTSDDLDGGTPA